MNREYVRGLVQLLVGLPTVWEDEPTPEISPVDTFTVPTDFSPSPGVVSTQQLAVGSRGNGLATITILSEEEWDQWNTYAYDLPTDGNIATARTGWISTLSVTIETYDPTWTSMDAARQLQRRFRFPSTIQSLEDNDMAFVRMLGVTRVPQVRDDRATSVAVLDFSLSYAEAEIDTAFDGGYIDTAPISGTPTP